MLIKPHTTPLIHRTVDCMLVMEQAHITDYTIYAALSANASKKKETFGKSINLSNSIYFYFFSESNRVV